MGVKLAVTLRAELMVTTQAPVPAHAPLHPVKAEPGDGVGVRVTLVLATNCALQVPPQSMPAGDEVTVPAPSPDLPTLSAKVGWNVAVTDLAMSIVTMHAPVPPHAPLQPVKAEPGSGVGVSVTMVFGGNVAVHVVPQSMPAGEELTEPEPAPPSETVRSMGAKSNVAVTLSDALIETLQTTDEPVHAPVQPTNAMPGSATASSATISPRL